MSSKVVEESGWLIEHGESEVSAPQYWCAGAYFQNGHDPTQSSAWTQNHMEAIRFARKEDAQKVANRMMRGILVRICEHVWTAPPEADDK